MVKRKFIGRGRGRSRVTTATAAGVSGPRRGGSQACNPSADNADMALPIAVALAALVIGLYSPYRLLEQHARDRGGMPVLWVTCALSGIALCSAAFETYEGIRNVTNTAVAGVSLQTQADQLIGAILGGLVEAGLLIGLAAGVYLVGIHVLVSRQDAVVAAGGPEDQLAS